MTAIKGIERLQGIISDQEISQLNKAANTHKKFSNIVFEIEQADEGELAVLVEQEQNSSGNYANQRTLIKRAHEVFDKVVPGSIKLNVKAQEYFESPTAKVTPQWIEQQMLDKEVRIKQIAFDTGINKSDISAWINGIKPMSQIVKALFYYYFNSR
ncbi:XRE family transcriptional regulator [Desertivirga arenae]|uniref:XRE family transcriptional regulator n=1 Tax=Desertivirga arenae TaxID=2810309 RepID=UPI001A972690|nr:XRE family transcriptional regulator [Pedobacter sp. SYSU D00823]